MSATHTTPAPTHQPATLDEIEALLAELRSADTYQGLHARSYALGARAGLAGFSIQQIRASIQHILS